MRNTQRSKNLKTASAENAGSPQVLSRTNGRNSVAPSLVFRRLLDNLEIGVAQAMPDGSLLYANDRFAQILGRPRKNLVNSNLTQFITPHSWSSLSEALSHGANAPVQGVMNVETAESSDQGERVIRMSFSPLRNEGTATVAIVATEVTRLVQAEQALEKSEASLQSISVQLLQVQDEERRRLARDLHDTTGQELSVIIMALDHLAKQESGEAEAIRKVIADSIQQLRKVEKDIRTLSYVLHPPLLDEMGLGVALRWYLDGFSKRTGLEVDTQIPNSVPRFELAKETALFRVIQESLTNVYRHSGGTRARVRLRVDAGSIEVCVEDNGHGFKTDVSAKPKSGVGVQSMKGRLEIVGGAFELRSGAHGATVTASVPIERRDGQDTASLPGKDLKGESNAPVAKRILIADDHYVARRGIRTLFDHAADLEICGEAADGVEAVRQAKELNPDLVILDLSMPKMGGLAAATRIRNAGLPAKILVYTSHSVPQLEQSARMAGCDGYVVKSDASRDLIRATRQVLSGGKFYRSEMAAGQSA